MNEPLKISAKNLGQTALEDFCPRCYWIKIRTNFKLPWASFPGIFSSIDSYTKSCVHRIIDNRYGNDSIDLLPEWMKKIGNVTGYEKVPHWSKNNYLDEKSNILLQGAQDDIFVRIDQSRAVVDWKTAKFTENQDKLRPLYDVQLNVYSILSVKDGKSPVDLYLVYMEPCTESSYATDNIIDCGFRMCFSGVVVPVKRDRTIVRKALTITRDIYEMQQPPSPRSGCKDCEQLDKVMGILGMGKVSNAGLEE
jgi:hypothetical protein